MTKAHMVVSLFTSCIDNKESFDLQTLYISARYIIRLLVNVYPFSFGTNSFNCPFTSGAPLIPLNSVINALTRSCGLYHHSEVVLISLSISAPCASDKCRAGSMAFTPDANTPIFRGKDAARVTSQSPIKQDKAAAVNIKRIRLLFIYCFISQMFSTYRAYETYQDFHSWDSLSRKNKFFLAWGVVTTVVMAFFTAGYMVLEYRRSKQGGKGQVV
ncbi:hypothetical protein F4801DRAFT_547046 [Xylaria longipes]|nr:hypothetical protein F4801DRAFT_547046 [Xylaria longipes]